MWESLLKCPGPGKQGHCWIFRHHRDVIEEYVNIKGVLVRILDTAGIRETKDLVEKIG